ncbi:pantetheine-phosphate adenylyltransferase [Corynebacterium ulceribovis]|uniref:pantetheine-phosphate adenylyltransferase n=1 Tax=Corynebacterium ulceribovis TaxID=487732 RepID=UPI00036CDE05|nr:pantetheine-phosphate adenylyltransferase [Corynebacterium ulceribovis]
MTHACCPGSFDPMTLGHLDIFERTAKLFDKVTVLVTFNPNKDGMFNPAERMELIRQSTEHLPNVEVDKWEKLLVDYTTDHGIDTLVKGLRNSLDYEYELPMARMNNRLSGIETVFLMTDPKFSEISSSLTKEVARYGGDITSLLPEPVAQAVRSRIKPE